MKHGKKVVNLDEVQFQTRRGQWWEKDVVKLAKKVTEDPDKELRLVNNLCKRCAYTNTIAGQAFTSYQCGICEQEQIYHNTSTPVLCLKCAKQHNLCVGCGADLNGKIRKKL